jgi:hypothetical protein
MNFYPMKTRHLIILFLIVIFFASCKRTVPIKVDPPSETKNENSSDLKNPEVPFMPIGIYGVNIPDMRRTAGYGFNVIQSYQFGSMTDTQISAYLDSAKFYGLKVLFHLGVQTYSTDIETKVMQRVSMFKNHPAMYAWYLSDEPSIAKISSANLKSIYLKIKAADPNHPVQTSNWELGNFKDATDYDLRQLYNGPPSALKLGKALAAEGAMTASYNLKWTGIANTHDCNNFPTYSPPGAETLSPAFILANIVAGSPEETAAKQKILTIQQNLQNPPFTLLGTFPDSPLKIRGQAFDIRAHGSFGIYYWLLQPETSLNGTYGYYTIFTRPVLRQGLTNVLHEVSALWPRIYSPADNSRKWSAGDGNNVFLWCRKTGNNITIIAVNESETTSNLSTSITELTNNQSIDFVVNTENRSVTLTNKILTDTFKPNEAHVYILTP